MRVYISIPSWKSEKLLKVLRQKAEVVVADKRPTQSEFRNIIHEYDGVIIGRLHSINKEIIENSKLKFVGLVAKGVDNIDIDECKKKNIAVFYTPNANQTSVAEHVMTLILSLSKNLVKLDKSVREEQFDEYRYSTIDIKDKILGVIGAGSIAREVIKRANSFDMNILCYTPHPEKHNDLKVKFVHLADLLKNSDFISINIPLTENTDNFIDTKELSVMKECSFLINTSRGKVVNEKALVEALKNQKIAGAGIDVFEEEPTHNKELFLLDNVILSPHVAGVSQEALNRMEEHVISDIISFLDNKKSKYRLV
ncbi:hydroxyacid dehydrogenase [Candidatus Parcubacteria bacterium]|nr:hydroxyacid dehydrogenase [Candidatus Parcubacteria bacterium]